MGSVAENHVVFDLQARGEVYVLSDTNLDFDIITFILCIL